MAQATIPLTVRELAKRVAGNVEGDDKALIVGVSSIEEAESGDIVFAENDRFLSQAEKSNASAIIAFLDATTPDKPLIKVDNPRYAFVKILELFAPKLSATAGIHPTAVVGESMDLGVGASIGANVFIGDKVKIGARTIVLPGAFIGECCELGEDCIIYPNVTINHKSLIGNRVKIHSGTVIGADGFGYTRVGDKCYKVPQIGIVEIEDDVEIGANCTIDRSKTGSTTIGARTKIDNLVHVAHNVKIGTDCILVAQVGVAGSVQLGKGVVLAGQAGIKDHTTIGDGAMVMAQAGLFGDVAAGEVVSGYPARPHRERLRQDAHSANLPEYVKRLRHLEKRNAELSAGNQRLKGIVELIARKAGFSMEEIEAALTTNHEE
jgi:UDP-3-O-[3-hydroxymyristoyl] glucosamine N-acyltransferase